jgi:hypothetical protein
MEIITIKVQTQAQVEIILAKIKEVGNEEMTITTKHSAKKRGQKEKVMAKPKVSKRLKAIEQGLREVKAIQQGEQQPKTIQQFLMELNSNG